MRAREGQSHREERKYLVGVGGMSSFCKIILKKEVNTCTASACIDFLFYYHFAKRKRQR